MLPLLLSLSLGTPLDDRARDDANLTFFVEDSLRGSWKVVKAEQDGRTLDEFQIAKFTFKGDRLTISFVGKSVEPVQMRYKLRPGENPKAVDLTFIDDKKAVALGIYELTGATLKLCVAEPEVGKRPIQFKSARQITYVELKRDKR
jgi:uncharacterized protein (TIGR03067 family)